MQPFLVYSGNYIFNTPTCQYMIRMAIHTKCIFTFIGNIIGVLMIHVASHLHTAILFFSQYIFNRSLMSLQGKPDCHNDAAAWKPIVISYQNTALSAAFCSKHHTKNNYLHLRSKPIFLLPLSLIFDKLKKVEILEQLQSKMRSWLMVYIINCVQLTLLILYAKKVPGWCKKGVNQFSRAQINNFMKFQVFNFVLLEINNIAGIQSHI